MLLVFALLLTASTGAPALEFRSPDTRSEDDVAVPATRHLGRLPDGNLHGLLQIGVFNSRQLACQREPCDPTAAELTNRLRTVE